MKRATLTTTNHSTIETLLANLQMNEMISISTPVGTITVQRIYHGAEAWLKSDSIPAAETGVRCHTAREAFTHQLTQGKRAADDRASLASLIDEVSEEAAIRAQFSALSYAIAFATSIKFAARLASMEVVARNFDQTLFSTSTAGALHTQTIYYPSESDSIFGACDCLRFRNTHHVCEHLSFIALTELFASVFSSAGEVTAA